MQSALPTPTEFWSSCIANTHRSAPRVWRGPLHPPLATDGELVRLLAEIGRAERPRGRERSLRLFLDGQEREPSPELLPRPEDRALGAYTARMEQVVRGQKFTVVLNDYHRSAPEHWMRLRDFLDALYSTAGYPPGGVTTNIVVENHGRTPPGVRRSVADEVTSVVAGRLRLLTWPAHVFEGLDPLSIDASEHLDDATTLEAEPGDLVYRPTGCWSITEPTDGFTATLSVVDRRESVPEVVRGDMAHYLERIRNPTIDVLDDASYHARVSSAQVMPPRLRATAEAMSESLRLRVAVRWVERLSNQGLSAPPLRDTELTPHDTIACPPSHPIVVLAHDDLLLLGACGRVVPVPSFPQIVSLVEALNTGARLRVDELIGRHSAGVPSDADLYEDDADLYEDDADLYEVDADALLDILRTLDSFRAFVRQ